MPPKLTTTSYALLGLLSRRSFSAYELTGYMRRSALVRLWPRTEASIYREPKTLQAHGLATARTEWTGDRKRTVYEITAAGRRALRTWLEQPADRFRFESEGALKAYFADATTLEHLRAHLERLAAQPLGGPERDPTLSADLLAGRAGFPDRLHLTAMTVDLVVRVNTAMRDWAVHWLANTEAWTSTALDDTSERQARAEVLAATRRLRRRVERDGH